MKKITGTARFDGFAKSEPVLLELTETGYSLYRSTPRQPSELILSGNIEQVFFDISLGENALRIDIKDWAIYPDLTIAEAKRISQSLPQKSFSNIVLTSWNYVGVLLFAVILFLIGLYYGTPLAANAMARFFPQSWAQSIDKQFLANTEWFSTAPNEGNFTSKQIRIKMLFSVVKSEFPELQLSVQESDLSGGLFANAFALPGGTVLIEKKMIENFSDKELIAVMAHEVGHIKLRHSIRRLIYSSMLSVLSFSIFGDIESGVVAAMITSSYSRQEELEADRFAANLLTKLQLEPKLLGKALKRLHNQNKDTPMAKLGKHLEFISSHPNLEDRIRTIEQDRSSL